MTLCCPSVAEGVLSKEKEMDAFSFSSLPRLGGMLLIMKTFQKLRGCVDVISGFLKTSRLSFNNFFHYDSVRKISRVGFHSSWF